MSDDLISRKALMKKLFYFSDGRKYSMKDIDNFPITIQAQDIEKIIREVPTAYNVDEVVKELEENQVIEFKLDGSKPKQTVEFQKAVEIVNRGVTNE